MDMIIRNFQRNQNSKKYYCVAKIVAKNSVKKWEMTEFQSLPLML